MYVTGAWISGKFFVGHPPSLLSFRRRWLMFASNRRSAALFFSSFLETPACCAMSTLIPPPGTRRRRRAAVSDPRPTHLFLPRIVITFFFPPSYSVVRSSGFSCLFPDAPGVASFVRRCLFSKQSHDGTFFSLRQYPLTLVFSFLLSRADSRRTRRSMPACVFLPPFLRHQSALLIEPPPLLLLR